MFKVFYEEFWKNINFKHIEFVHLKLIPIALYKDIVLFQWVNLHVYGCN